ncbi:MAG: hypothetical protein R3230_00845 [Nitrosopumilaceae archaeon]|nr:hypothetical protein [Nitrosopumilaceae archaeon]
MSRLSSSIPSQLSSTIRQNYPRFVEFLSAYYEWLENPDNPYYHIRNHLSFLDFEKSLELYTDMMKKEYLVNIPEKILGNPELFIKYSKQFNLSIGSKKSFNFVFNMLYGEDVEIHYPKDDILRGSDGKWVTDEYKLYVTSEYDPELFLNRRIIQRREIGPNIFEETTATVLRVKSRFVNRFKFTEIVVTDLDGTFEFDYPVYPQDNTSAQEWFMPVGVGYTVNDGGINYRQGDLITLTTTDQYIISRSAVNTGRFDTRVTSDFNKSDIEVYVNAVQLLDNEYVYDGRIITTSEITAGDDIEIRLPLYTGFIIVDEVGGTLGDIKTINIIEPPIGINGSPYTLDADEGGSGADIEIVSGTQLQIPGYYRNDDGHLSGTKVLQDGDFYQEFSYVIKSSQNIDSYRDVVLDVLHPAGMKLFGQINIKFLINLMIREIQFDINIKPPVQLFVSSPSLGPTTSFLDRIKLGFEDELVKTENYLDVVSGDVIDTPLKRTNITDFEYSAVCVDEYIDSGYYEFGYICEGANDVVNCIDEYTEIGYYQYGYICDANV